MFRIIQTWWHIENRTHPSNSIVLTEVTDIYTNEPFIYYHIDEYFVGLTVKNQYTNHDLVFVQRKDFIQINLGNLKKDWPKSILSDDTVRHVKVKIKYTDMNPAFEDSFPRLGYNNTYTVNGIAQPEFRITVPLGMKLKNKGKDIRLLLKKANGEFFKLHYASVDTEQVNGKLTYNILLRDNSFKKITEIPDTEASKVEIKVNYSVINQNRYKVFLIIPLLLLIFGFLEYIWAPVVYSKFPDIFIASLTYVIIFITFITFYIGLIKDGYEIPWNTHVLLLTPISAFLLIIPQMIPAIFTNLKIISIFLVYIIIQNLLFFHLGAINLKRYY